MGQRMIGTERETMNRPEGLNNVGAIDVLFNLDGSCVSPRRVN
jgi:hypothetical protein